MSLAQYKSTFGQSEFDPNKFNAEFENEKQKIKEQNQMLDQEALDRLANNNINKLKIYELSIGELLIGIKNTWFGIIDDILDKKFKASTFVQNYRLFYIGLTFLLIGIIMHMYNILIE